MAPQKGKVGTKGQKQIAEENKSTLRFYTIMSAVAMVIYVLVMFLLSETFSYKFWLITLFSGSVYSGCIVVLQYMAKAIISPTGAVIDGGTDLNMESGFAENLKDLIILTTGVQTLSLISNYFWILWLFAPGRALYMLWVNILGPWFFAPAPEPEADEKKQKKMERRMRRMQ